MLLALVADIRTQLETALGRVPTIVRQTHDAALVDMATSSEHIVEPQWPCMAAGRDLELWATRPTRRYPSASHSSSSAYFAAAHATSRCFVS